MRRESAAYRRGLKKELQPKAGNVNSERGAKRARRADADYATSERDAKRALRADADQKKLQQCPSSGYVFIAVPRFWAFGVRVRVRKAPL
jgi:hypothetical protein